MTTESLIDLTIVAKFGRERTMHAYRVTVVGDDTVGYRCQPQTKCGQPFDDTTKTMPGAVTCQGCEAVS